MDGLMLDWLIMGIAFAGAPALVLARRWDAVAAGITIPRACGPAPAPAPEPTAEPVIQPEPAPAFLRLGRIDEAMDADRRAGRLPGMVRAAR